MKKKKILKLVEFCILMEKDNGILGKAPSYIMEKWWTTDGRGLSLDVKNTAIFNDWKELWIPEGEEREVIN